MTNVVKVKRSTGSTAPGSLNAGELAWVDGLNVGYIGKAVDGTVLRAFGLGLRHDEFAAPNASVPWGSQKITNLADPGAAQDAATQNYVLTRTLNNFVAPTGDLSINSHKLTNVTDCTNPQDAATKNYVDSVAQGLSVKQSCKMATAAVLPNGPAVYANGASGVGATLTAASNAALVVDGVTAVAGDRVLVKNEAAPANNGIFSVTTVGDGSTYYVLTRALDMDDAIEPLSGKSEYIGAFTFVEAGTVNTSSGWVQTGTAAITVGTTAINFTQFSGAGELTGTTNRITITANAIDISTNYVGQATITTLGTIGTGVWNGTAVGVGFGGTGIATAALNGVVIGQGTTNPMAVTAAGTANQIFRVPNGGGAPAFGGLSSITDVNGATVVGFTATGTAVNYVNIANSAATGALAISAIGTDTDVTINIVPKGAGTVKHNGVVALDAGSTIDGGTF